MLRIRTRGSVLATLAVGAALTLAACGSDSDNGGEAASGG